MEVASWRTLSLPEVPLLGRLDMALEEAYSLTALSLSSSTILWHTFDFFFKKIKEYLLFIFNMHVCV